MATAVLCAVLLVRMMVPFDVALTTTLQDLNHGAWRSLMLVVTDIGGGWVALSLTGLLAFALFLRRWYLESVVVLGVYSVTVVIPALKAMVDRPRPSALQVLVEKDFSGASFPSGHATLAMVLFGLLFYFAPVLSPNRYAAMGLRVVSIAMVVLTGLSRVYLGAHWSSDVVAGYLVGGLILAALIATHRLAIESRRLPASPRA